MTLIQGLSRGSVELTIPRSANLGNTRLNFGGSRFATIPSRKWFDPTGFVVQFWFFPVDLGRFTIMKSFQDTDPKAKPLFQVDAEVKEKKIEFIVTFSGKEHKSKVDREGPFGTPFDSVFFSFQWKPGKSKPTTLQVLYVNQADNQLKIDGTTHLFTETGSSFDRVHDVGLLLGEQPRSGEDCPKAVRWGMNLFKLWQGTLSEEDVVRFARDQFHGPLTIKNDTGSDASLRGSWLMSAGYGNRAFNYGQLPLGPFAPNDGSQTDAVFGPGDGDHSPIWGISLPPSLAQLYFAKSITTTTIP